MKFGFPVLGIDVGGQNIKAGLVVEGTVKNFHKFPFNRDKVVEELLNVIAIFEITSDTIIGVGFPGFIKDGKVFNPPNLPAIHELDLMQFLKEKTGSPVYVINDANACILGEALHGVAKEYNIVVGFTLGTGVGGGIIIDKKVYTGGRGFASEFGHMTIDPSGPLCNCSKHGCLEAFIGSYALIRRYKVLTGENITVKEIFKRANRGEVNAKEIVNEFAFYLGIGISNIVEITDPEVVVLAGGISKSGGQIIKALESKNPFEARCIKGVRIEISEFGDKAGPVGAANWAHRKHQ